MCIMYFNHNFSEFLNSAFFLLAVWQSYAVLMFPPFSNKLSSDFFFYFDQG